MMFTNYEKNFESLFDMNESALLSAARTGDLEAFNQIVLFYQDRIFSLAVRIMGDEAAAEDVTQDTFLTAYRSLPGFRNGSFRSWLYRIATNNCYDALRRLKSHPVQPLELDGESEERFPPGFDFSNSSPSPEKEYERHEMEQTLQRAINQLEMDFRTVVVLVDLQDFSYQEAAQILRVPIGTVKSRLARARRQLRHLLSSLIDIR